jgi:hypothetical protein
VIVHDAVKGNRQAIARSSPSPKRVEIQWNACGRNGMLVGCNVTPRVQFRQKREARNIRRVNCQIEPEAESVEILFEMRKGWIAVVNPTMAGELFLNQRLEPCSHFGGDDLGGLGMQIAAETLEVSAEQKSIAAQVLVNQARIQRHSRYRGSALKINLLETKHPLILPVQQ